MEDGLKVYKSGLKVVMGDQVAEPMRRFLPPYCSKCDYKIIVVSVTDTLYHCLYRNVLRNVRVQMTKSLRAAMGPK